MRVGQFGNYYTELAHRFFHAVEWQYQKHHIAGHDRECEILSKVLDTLISDAVSRDIPLMRLEAANKELIKIRDQAFGARKYHKILDILEISESETHGYEAQLFGVVEYNPRTSI